jgi:hypothetical protein
VAVNERVTDVDICWYDPADDEDKYNTRIVRYEKPVVIVENAGALRQGTRIKPNRGWRVGGRVRMCFVRIAFAGVGREKRIGVLDLIWPWTFSLAGLHENVIRSTFKQLTANFVGVFYGIYDDRNMRNQSHVKILIHRVLHVQFELFETFPCVDDSVNIP